MMRLNGTPYTYVKNLQGDIVGLIDSTGALIVEYKYDACGNPISTRTLTSAYDALAELNPFRYRGYMLDEETSLFCLETRYYSPVYDRFINSDTLLANSNSLIGSNLFTYCVNNPVRHIDIAGEVTCDLFNEDPERDNNPFNDIASSGNTNTPKTTIYIYRYGGKNPSNLTPKMKDSGTGLSFSTTPKNGAAVTTIDAVNSTNTLRAIQDSPTHVSIVPVNGSIQDWISSGSTSTWTATLRSIVTIHQK